MSASVSRRPSSIKDFAATIRPRLAALAHHHVHRETRGLTGRRSSRSRALVLRRPRRAVGQTSRSLDCGRCLMADGYQVLSDGRHRGSAGPGLDRARGHRRAGPQAAGEAAAAPRPGAASLCERVAGLLEAGWRQVVVVTDHGWLYVPGGLPKVELPYYLTKDERMKKGRTGRFADGADGAGGHRALVLGSRCADGGRARDRDLRRRRRVRARWRQPAGMHHARSSLSRRRAHPVDQLRSSIGWRGLRADVSAAGAPEGSLVDLRRKAGDASSSLLAGTAFGLAGGRGTDPRGRR